MRSDHNEATSAKSFLVKDSKSGNIKLKRDGINLQDKKIGSQPYKNAKLSGIYTVLQSMI